MGISAAVLSFLGAMLLPGPATAPVRGPLCAPEPAVGEVLAQLDQTDETCVDPAACRETKRRLIEEALEKHPDDLFLHRASQDLLLNKDVAPEERAGVERVYKARLDQHPADPLWLSLYARSVPFTRDGERLEAWTRALALDPTFAPARLELAWLRQASATHKDVAEAREHAEAYGRLCPEGLDLLGYLRQADGAQQAEGARRARAVLERQNDGRGLRRYSTLWALEFKAAPPAEHDAVRARIRADVERLRALGLEARPLWWEVLAEGSGLLGDAQRKDELERARLERFPCAGNGPWERQRRWSEAHPYPTSPEREAWTSHARASYAVSGEWVRQCPDSLADWMERFNAVHQLEEVPNEELGSVVDRFLDLWARPNRGLSSWPAPHLRVAHAYVDRGFRLERVDDLVRQGLVASEARQAEMEATAKTDERRQGLAAMRQTTLWNARTCQVRAALGLGRAADAALAIEELEKLAREAEGPDARSDQWRRNQIASYRSQRAESEGRRLDALFLALAVPSGPERTKAQAQVDRLWQDLGGTDEGREALKRLERAKAPAPQAVDTPSDWAAKDTPLADFDLVDLAGKTWTKKDLAGRTTLLNVWSTTCGPCKWELPHIQKLHERIRDRHDVILLSLNVDDNPGVVQPFLAQQGYNFPVLLAADWIEKTLRGEYGIPMNWIVSADGVLRYETVGFGPNAGDKWADEVIARLVSVAERRAVP